MWSETPWTSSTSCWWGGGSAGWSGPGRLEGHGSRVFGGPGAPGGRRVTGPGCLEAQGRWVVEGSRVNGRGCLKGRGAKGRWSRMFAGASQYTGPDGPSDAPHVYARRPFQQYSTTPVPYYKEAEARLLSLPATSFCDIVSVKQRICSGLWPRAPRLSDQGV